MAAATSAFKIQCPSCEARVTIKDSSLAGKKIDCPKCKYRFVVEVPAENGDNNGNTTAKKGTATGTDTKSKAKGESTNGTATKTKNKPLPKADGDDGGDEGKKKKKKQSNSKVTLYVGGGLGVVAIGVLICYFAGVFDGDSGGSSGNNSGGGNTPTPGPQAKGPPNPGTDPNTGTPNQGGGNTEIPQPKENPEVIARKDPTNLLPGESQYVLKVNAEQFIKSPVGSVFFDESSDSAGAFKRWMGFSGDDVDRFICAGGVDAPWFFGVFTLKKDIRIEGLQAAMELDPKPTLFARPAPKGKNKSNEKARELYTIRSNEVIKMLGEYLAAKLPTVGVNTPQSNGNRTYALNLLDSRTLIIADQAYLERFLKADARPNFITTYSPNEQPMGNPEEPGTMPEMGNMEGGPGPGPMGGPAFPPMGMSGGPGPSPMGPPMGMMGGPRPMGPMGGPAFPPMGMSGGPRPMGPMGPMGGPAFPPMGMSGGSTGGITGGPAQGGGNQGRSITSNPSFLTVDRSLKSMLNQLEDEKGSVLVFAAKLTDSHKVLGDLVRQHGTAGGLAITLIPKQTVVGVCVKRMDETRLKIQAAIEYPDSKDAYELAENQIIQKFTRYLADQFTQMTRVEVTTGQGGGAGPGTGPFGPGTGPFGPGPGGIGPMGPGPVGPGGFRPMGPGGFGPGSPDGPGGRSSMLPTVGDNPASALAASDDDVDDDIYLIAQRPPPPPGPGPGPVGPGPVGPGPVGPGPVGPGPVGPGPVGPGPGPGPGEPDPNNPSGNSTSYVAISSSDKLLVIDIEIEWKPKYYEHVSPSIRTHADQLKGEALMMTGRAHWHQLAGVVKRFEQQGAFPIAAFPRKTDSSRFDLSYPPDQRVSWMCDMLPFLGYDGLSRRIHREDPWSDERNLQAGSAWISEFLNPEFPRESWRARVPSLKGRDLGATHFVGLTGIGMESGEFPDTPEYAKKLGLFGWNRQTKFADVSDGLSNTIFMIQAPPSVSRPWLRGGGATAQGVPTSGSLQPFVADLKGRRGAYVLMGDGSVRFLKEGMADPIFQALVTYKGGDQIPDIDAIAPREGRKEVAIVTPPPKVEPKVEPKAEPPKVDSKAEPSKVEPKVEPKAEPPKTDPSKIEPKAERPKTEAEPPKSNNPFLGDKVTEDPVPVGARPKLPSGWKEYGWRSTGFTFYMPGNSSVIGDDEPKMQFNYDRNRLRAVHVMIEPRKKDRDSIQQMIPLLKAGLTVQKDTVKEQTYRYPGVYFESKDTLREEMHFMVFTREETIHIRIDKKHATAAEAKLIFESIQYTPKGTK